MGSLSRISSFVFGAEGRSPSRPAAGNRTADLYHRFFTRRPLKMTGGLLPRCPTPPPPVHISLPRHSPPCRPPPSPPIFHLLPATHLKQRLRVRFSGPATAAARHRPRQRPRAHRPAGHRYLRPVGCSAPIPTQLTVSSVSRPLSCTSTCRPARPDPSAKQRRVAATSSDAASAASRATAAAVAAVAAAAASQPEAAAPGSNGGRGNGVDGRNSDASASVG